MLKLTKAVVIRDVQSVSSFGRYAHCFEDKTRDFSDMEINTNKELIWSPLKTYARASQEGGTSDGCLNLANHDEGLSAINQLLICSTLNVTSSTE